MHTLTVLLLTLLVSKGSCQGHMLEKTKHIMVFVLLLYLTLYMEKLPDGENALYIKEVVDKLLIPRVVGSKGHQQVRNFIISEMERHNFKINVDDFKTRVPIFRVLKFSNIMATYNPEADSFLTLACHYDSKYFKKNQIPFFVGATDSAVPCAIMIALAKILQPHLQSMLAVRRDIGLMFVFFDGEEAFENWTKYDSLYGSRHLAQKLSNTTILRGNRRVRSIDRIKLLILLDLIGAPNPMFYSFFKNTQNVHNSLSKIETGLRTFKYLHSENQMFQQSTLDVNIDDDHRPFLERNVPILHLIPYPFPKVWHTEADNKDALDWNTIFDMEKILRAFIFSYVKLHNDTWNYRN